MADELPTMSLTGSDNGTVKLRHALVASGPASYATSLRFMLRGKFSLKTYGGQLSDSQRQWSKSILLSPIVGNLACSQSLSTLGKVAWAIQKPGQLGGCR